MAIDLLWAVDSFLIEIPAEWTAFGYSRSEEADYPTLVDFFELYWIKTFLSFLVWKLKASPVSGLLLSNEPGIESGLGGYD